MSTYQLHNLNRNEYIASIEAIEDERTLRFANMCLLWWDKQYLWPKQDCIVLKNEEGEELCYVFYHVDRYREYMTIHNIFTPMQQRRKGHAHTLIKMIFDLAAKENVSRFRLTSISNSLDFYLSLGLIYWGVNSVGDYYCDLPVPREGLDSLVTMIEGLETSALIGKSQAIIQKKIGGNMEKLTPEQTLICQGDMIKMGEHYRNESFLSYKAV